MEAMYLRFHRWLPLAAACVLIAACSTTPTSPSSTDRGPVISQGALAGLIPQEPPAVPPRVTAPPPTPVGASKFVAFGDSITYGTLSSYDGSFVYDVPTHSYSVRLKIALDTYHAPRVYTVVNEGAPGEWAQQGAQRIQSVLTQHRPQGLLLLEGINDLANDQSISQTVSSLGRILDVARSNNVTVLIATMPQTYETTNPTTGEYRTNARELVPALNTAIRQLASGRQNVYVVDLYAAFGTTGTYMGGDGLHPNEAGYERMASTFLSSIESVFAIKGSFQ